MSNSINMFCIHAGQTRYIYGKIRDETNIPGFSQKKQKNLKMPKARSLCTWHHDMVSLLRFLFELNTGFFLSLSDRKLLE